MVWICVFGRPPADRTNTALSLSHPLIIFERNPVAVLELGISSSIFVQRTRRPVAVCPLLFGIVRLAHTSADSRFVAPSNCACNAFPLASLSLKATILWAVVKLRALIHLRPPPMSVKNGCLPFARTILPDLVVIFNAESLPLALTPRTFATDKAPCSYVATTSPDVI